MKTPIASATAIGMLHVPINTILSAPHLWRRATRVPNVSPSDWDTIRDIGDSMGVGGDPCRCTCAEEHIEKAKSLSVFTFMEERMLVEASIYMKCGCRTLMTENVAAPYFVRNQQPLIIYWVMRALSDRLRAEYPDAKLGTQVLAYSDDWAMDIACRSGLDFIRCESAFFEGLRPEGRTPNHGNLAKLYMQRQACWQSVEGD